MLQEFQLLCRDRICILLSKCHFAILAKCGQALSRTGYRACYAVMSVPIGKGHRF